MSLSTELLKRLNTAEEPLPKRLKLAENVFYAVDLPVVRREDLVLDWLCHTSLDDERVWSTLESCLSKSQLDIKGDVKKLLIRVITENLKQNSITVSENVFRCIRLITNNPTLQQYFIREPCELGSFVNSLLNNLYDYFKTALNIDDSVHGIDIALIQNSTPLVLLAYNTVVGITEDVLQICKSSFSNKEQLTMVFIKDIIHPLCRIVDHKCTDSQNRLGAQVHKCIQQMIFGKKPSQNKDSECHEGSTGFMDLALELMKNIDEATPRNNIMTCVIVFRAAVGVYKSNNAMLDIVFRSLIDASPTYRKEIMNACLKYTHDLTLDFDHKINDVTLLAYCQEIVDEIVNSDCFADVDYELVTQMLYFNPLIVEKKIPQVLTKILLHKRTPEWIQLMLAILDSSIRLRKEEKLISQILISLRNCLSEGTTAKIHKFFPNEFKEKFMKTVNHITNSQIIVIVRTLLFHLSNDCIVILESNESCKNMLMMKATIELLITFFNGICIFEGKGITQLYEKLIVALDDMAQVLTQLVTWALQLNYNKTVTILILRAIESWSEVETALKFYVPKANIKNCVLPVDEEHWQQLIQRIANFGTENSKNIMNKLILHKVRAMQNESDKFSIKTNHLVGGLTDFWPHLLKNSPDLISYLSNEDISKVTELLLTEITSNSDNCNQWMEVLTNDSIQESKIFIVALLTNTLTQIGDLLSSGTTSRITKYIEVKMMTKAEIAASTKINKVIKMVKEELVKQEWITMDKSIAKQINACLELLLNLPLIFLNSHLRIVIFLIVYSLSKECSSSKKTLKLCQKILSGTDMTNNNLHLLLAQKLKVSSFRLEQTDPLFMRIYWKLSINYTTIPDLSEKPGMNIWEFIDPLLLMEEALHNKSLQRIIEQCIRNDSSYDRLKKFVKSATDSKEQACLLLDTVENVKPKLNTAQRINIKKAEMKLSKALLNMLTPDAITPLDIRTIGLIAKLYSSNDKVDEKLKNLAETTLTNVFMLSNEIDLETMNEVKVEGMRLAAVLLHSRKMFEIPEETLKKIWADILQRPCMDLLSPLLESSGISDFQYVLDLLHTQVLDNIANENNDMQENVLVIWKAIMKTDMSVDRNKLRLAAITELLGVLQTLPARNSIGILKLISTILNAKHFHLPGSLLDASLSFALKSVEEMRIDACEDAMTICGVLVKARASLITDRLPVLLLLFRRIVGVIVDASKKVADKSQEHALRCLGLNMEKFTGSLIKLKKDLARLAPYLIADLLELFSDGSIAIYIKGSLQNCISQLISICDQHAIALLSRALPASMQEIFKLQVDIFHKFYKFSGKI